jgi:hypothetical protein
MKIHQATLLAIATLPLVTACGGDRFMPPPVRAAMTAARVVSHEENKDADNSIPNDDVPANILSAAQTKVPGFILESAQLDKKLIRSNYELAGYAQGQRYKITVNRLGIVTHVDQN